MDAKFSVATAMISEPPEPSHFAWGYSGEKIAEIPDGERDLLNADEWTYPDPARKSSSLITALVLRKLCRASSTHVDVSAQQII
jgi:hypothetical protein